MSGANAPAYAVNFWDDALGSCVPNTTGPWVDWQADMLADCCAGGLIVASDGVPRGFGYMVIMLLFLFYVFMGVALGAEVFMTAIEVVTSVEKKKSTVDADGKAQIYHVKVWNATVANLTLMALGSSAPEILLNVFEVVLLESFNSGALGPSTIVGSAAFNLMIITAVCLVCLPEGEKRTIKQLGVFLTTAFYSVLAYIWLLFMVVVWTPDVISVAEGIITVLLLCILIAQAYYMDKKATAADLKKKTIAINKDGSAPRGQVSKDEAKAAIKAAHLGKDASPEEIRQVLEEELLPPKSRLHYRKKAMAQFNQPKAGGTTKVTPTEGGEDDPAAPAGAPMRSKLDPAMGEKTPPSAIDPATPGVLCWVNPTYAIDESAGSVTIEAERRGGSKGAVSCAYKTKNQKAVAGKDYEAAEGTFEWADGETAKKSLTIIIKDDDEFEKDEDFTVIMQDATGGATFNLQTDGGDETEVCTVTIVNDDDRVTRMTEAIKMLRMDTDQLDIAGDDWARALKESVVPPEGASPVDLATHFLMVPWKLMFALCPPPGLCGGWPCFFISLALIGFQVVLISDFANFVGCQMFLKPSVTAITFVALGTSLPDTFASMQAARGDKWADNSIGNVTGSNSVNVFFGLGLPWLVGALYWAIAGGNAAWQERFGPGGQYELPKDLYDQYKVDGAFVVRGAGLDKSVITFTVCAILTLGLILVRRQMGNQELGGNKMGAYASAVFLVFLWCIYLLVSIMTTYYLI